MGLSSMETLFSLRDTDNTKAVTYHAGFRHRMSRLLSFIAEVDSGEGSTGPNDDFETAPGALLDFALRISDSQFGMDIGFIRPVGVGTGEFAVGLPWVPPTFRSEVDSQLPIPCLLPGRLDAAGHQTTSVRRIGAAPTSRHQHRRPRSGGGCPEALAEEKTVPRDSVRRESAKR